MAKKNNKDKSLTNQYIRAIENPDSVGLNNGYWYQAPNSVFDANNRGFGIDVKYNKEAANLVKNRKGKYLTEEEERNLRNSYVGYLEGLLDDYTPPIANYPSDIKKAMATGLLYRGDGTKSIFKNPAMQSTYLFGTDNDFEKAVADYYKSKGLDERAKLHTEFVDNQKPIEDKQIDWFSSAISVPMLSTLPEVEVVAKYPHEQRVIDTMNASNAEFMQRLRNNDKRAIHNPDGSYSTHVLGSADNIVFPAIQDVNGKLKDFRAMPWQRTLDWAIRNKDYIEFPTEGDARYFGEHYKKYYPEFFNDGDNNQYAEGGELEAPKHWDKLSLADKSDVMAAAISNGITSLDDIRQAWNDFADNSHEYAKGGYKPSAAIKSEIANWEGSSMKTNRSFEAEAADFNRVIPAAVRSKLTQKQLDALYSYGYNVGMGNLKARVLPTLTAYTQGRVDAGDVASSMWASKDPLMKGLQRRRAWERGMFTGEAPIERQGSIIDRAINMDLSHLPSMYFKGEINNPLIQHPYYTAPKVELPKEESKPVTLEGINKDLDDDNGLSNFFKVQQMMGAVGMDNGLSSNSFLGAWSNFLNGNVFATGGQKGVTSSNGNYHVSPADVANSMWASKDMYLRGLQRRRAWERGMFTDHSPMGRQGSVINDAIHMDLSGLRSLNDNTSNPLWKSNNFTVPKIVLSDEEPAIQRNYDLSFKEEKPIDNFIKLQQIMSAMDNGSDNQQSIVSQANRQMYVANVSSSDNNDTFLDNMWFSKGGYLYDDGGMASIYPTMDNDEHLTNVNAYTTASGHPVEQIGWDDNGYARFRDTVTGDLGKAYEPTDDYGIIAKRVTNTLTPEQKADMFLKNYTLEQAVKDNQTASNDNLWIENGREKNPNLDYKGIVGGRANAAWEQEHPALAKWQYVPDLVTFGVVAYPFAAGASDAAMATSAGQAISGPLVDMAMQIGRSKWMPWADALATAYFGQDAINNDIMNGEVTPETVLELAPMARVGKGIAQETANIAKKPSDYISEMSEPFASYSRSVVNKLINVNPDGTWNMQRIADDTQRGGKAAQDFLGSAIKREADAHNIELAKRIGYNGFTPFADAQARSTYPIKPDFTSLSADDSALGSVELSGAGPQYDTMQLNLFGDLDKSAFHETLHRGFYGMPEKRVLANTPESNDWYLNTFRPTRKFYNWKQEKLLQPLYSDNSNLEILDYLSKDGEAYTNAMEIGRRMGIAPGTPYPGKEKALKLFRKFADSTDDKSEIFKYGYNWEKKPLRIWQAITGRYVILPVSIGLGATSGIFSNNNNEKNK